MAKIERWRFKPDYRNNGAFQFVTGYTGGGAEMCVHLRRDEIAEKLAKEYGPGELVDNGTYLSWLQDEDIAVPALADESMECSSL
jgi:hypothetical protein